MSIPSPSTLHASHVHPQLCRLLPPLIDALESKLNGPGLSLLQSYAKAVAAARGGGDDDELRNHLEEVRAMGLGGGRAGHKAAAPEASAADAASPELAATQGGGEPVAAKAAEGKAGRKKRTAKVD